jgi:hypothetical protein
MAKERRTGRLIPVRPSAGIKSSGKILGRGRGGGRAAAAATVARMHTPCRNTCRRARGTRRRIADGPAPLRAITRRVKRRPTRIAPAREMGVGLLVSSRGGKPNNDNDQPDAGSLACMLAIACVLVHARSHTRPICVASAKHGACASDAASSRGVQRGSGVDTGTTARRVGMACGTPSKCAQRRRRGRGDGAATIADNAPDPCFAAAGREALNPPRRPYARASSRRGGQTRSP